LYISTMPARPAKTRFLLSLYHTPTGAAGDVFYSVMRAGHLTAGADHHIDRESYPGHELILCLKGRGQTRLGGKVFDVAAGQLLWVNCHHPHAYWANAGDPWELYWLRFDGPRADRLWQMLHAATRPVFSNLSLARARASFERIFKLLQSHRPDAPAWVHAELARLTALLTEARQTSGDEPEPDFPFLLRKPIESMRLYFHRPWHMRELAAQAGMSQSHFFRLFRTQMGASPNEWLRRERITQAKRRLIETDDSVKEVAQQTGYSDQFFFSKDFKRVTGFTPTEFRQRERGQLTSQLGKASK